jgi:lysophospholipase L1-like esterase
MNNRELFAIVASAVVGMTAWTASAQTRILPLGDSGTSSFAPHSSYRYWLWQYLVNAGLNVNFVGTQRGVAGGVPTNTDFDQDHDGHPGWTTQDALANIDRIASATRPDIVLVDLGDNDVMEGVPMQNTVSNLEQIIERLRAVNPNVIILLGQPTPYIGPNHKNVSKLKGAIGKIAKAQNQPESPVMKVNLCSGFNVRKDTFDGMHPDESGEQKIAYKFFAALMKVGL